MGKVIAGPWTKFALLKELLERETQRLQVLIEQYQETRRQQTAKKG